MASTSRVSKHRAGLRAQGFRPVQLWVPDTRSESFARECQRQAALVTKSDLADGDLMDFLDLALADLNE